MTTAERPWPRPALGWTTVALLTLAYILSYVDRSILALLAKPIEADLHLTDEQFGLLLGWAFGLFYATVGVPLGGLADRTRRTALVAAGVFVWSLATIGSGLVTGFAGLFAMRMLVGVGEATLSPCALSLIADSFPPERRGRPVGVYSTALALGAGLAGVIGGAVLARAGAGITLPGVGALRPWQLVLVAVGLPGLVLAPLFLLLREPPRRGRPVARAPLREALREVRAHPVLAGVALLVATMTTIAYSQGFNAKAFGLAYGWSAARYAQVNGLVSLLVAPPTVLAVGAIADRWRRRGRRDAAFRLLAIGFVAMLPLNTLPWLMPTASLALAMLGLGSMAIATVTAAGILAFVEIAPPGGRGQLVALYYMALSVAGLGLGPPTVGVLSTRLWGPAHLDRAIATIPLLYGLVPLLLLPAIARAYRRRLAETA